MVNLHEPTAMALVLSEDHGPNTSHNSEDDTNKLTQLLALRRELQNELNDTVAKAKAIQARISDLTPQCARLSNKRIPILALPTEVACKIFKAGERCEVQISHVCHQWRSISLALPFLWNNYFCSLGVPDKDASRRILGRLDAYLERSSSRELDITIVSNDALYNHPAVFEVLESMLKALVKEASRWRRFSLQVEYVDFRDDIFWPLHQITLPKLESMDILLCPVEVEEYPINHHPDAYFLPLPQPLRDVFPKLTHLRMDTCSLKGCISFPIPTSVTTLRLDGDKMNTRFRWTDFLSLLASPALSDLSLSGPIFEGPDLPDPNHHIVKTNLKSWRIRKSSNVASYMWLYVYAPHLELLVLSGHEDNLDHPSFIAENDPLTIHFNRSDAPRIQFPALRTLGLHLCSSTRGASFLTSLARATQRITHLIFICWGFDWNNLSHVMVSHPQTNLWPQLDELTLRVLAWRGTFEGGPATKFPACLDFVERRVNNVKKFRLQILEDDAEEWQRQAVDVWNRLERVVPLQILPCDALDHCYPPWSNGKRWKDGVDMPFEGWRYD